MQFTLFLISVFLWAVLGFTMGLKIHSLKKQRHTKIRLIFTTTSAALLGGLLAELSNGSPDYGISFTNLLVAGFAAFLAVYLTYPAYAVLAINKIKNLDITLISRIREKLLTGRQK